MHPSNSPSGTQQAAGPPAATGRRTVSPEDDMFTPKGGLLSVEAVGPCPPAPKKAKPPTGLFDLSGDAPVRKLMFEQQPDSSPQQHHQQHQPPHHHQQQQWLGVEAPYGGSPQRAGPPPPPGGPSPSHASPGLHHSASPQPLQLMAQQHQQRLQQQQPAGLMSPQGRQPTAAKPTGTPVRLFR